CGRRRSWNVGSPEGRIRGRRKVPGRTRRRSRRRPRCRVVVSSRSRSAAAAAERPRSAARAGPVGWGESLLQGHPIGGVVDRPLWIFWWLAFGITWGVGGLGLLAGAYRPDWALSASHPLYYGAAFGPDLAALIVAAGGLRAVSGAGDAADKRAGGEER